VKKTPCGCDEGRKILLRFEGGGGLKRGCAIQNQKIARELETRPEKKKNRAAGYKGIFPMRKEPGRSRRD